MSNNDPKSIEPRNNPTDTIGMDNGAGEIPDTTFGGHSDLAKGITAGFRDTLGANLNIDQFRSPDNEA